MPQAQKKAMHRKRKRRVLPSFLSHDNTRISSRILRGLLQSGRLGEVTQALLSEKHAPFLYAWLIQSCNDPRLSLFKMLDTKITNKSYRVATTICSRDDRAGAVKRRCFFCGDRYTLWKSRLLASRLLNDPSYTQFVIGRLHRPPGRRLLEEYLGCTEASSSSMAMFLSLHRNLAAVWDDLLLGDEEGWVTLDAIVHVEAHGSKLYKKTHLGTGLHYSKFFVDKMAQRVYANKVHALLEQHTVLHTHSRLVMVLLGLW